MRTRTDRILLASFVLSMALCIALWFIELTALLFVTAVPAFLIQLWLCRVTAARKLRIIPLILLLLFAATGGLILLFGDGWDKLLGVIMMGISIAPAVGLLLARIVFALSLRRQQNSLP